MIGGDNDGDTIGMAAINKEQYEAGNFKLIDATLDDYYDTPRSSKDKKAGYIESIKKDLEFKPLNLLLVKVY